MTALLFPVDGHAIGTPEAKVLERFRETLMRDPSLADLSFDQRHSVYYDIVDYIQSSFDGKTPPPYSPTHLIEHSAPGSGRTYNARKSYDQLPDADKKHWIYGSYDEDGALYAVSLYRQELAQAQTWEERLAARDRYRYASDIGYNIVKNRAITERYNFWNDTTASSKGGGIMTMQLVREQGGTNHCYSAFAPYERCRQRCIDRPRTLEMESELRQKRIGAHAFFRPVLAEVLEDNGLFSLIYNPSNDRPPHKVMEISARRVTHFDWDLYNKIERDMADDLRHDDWRAHPNRDELYEAGADYLDALKSIGEEFRVSRDFIADFRPA